MAYSPSSRTVGEVMRAVKRQFGDESGVQLEDADIVGWINDAQTTINNKNRVLKAKSTVSSIAGQGIYTFPAMQIRQVEAIHYKGERVPNMAFETAQSEIIGNQDPTGWGGTPTLWYEWAGTFTFWPVPQAVEDITIYYTVEPTPVDSNDSTTLSLPDKYFKNIVDYVLQQAYEMDEDWQASQAKAQQFTDSVNEMGEEERTAQTMTYSTITVVDI